MLGAVLTIGSAVMVNLDATEVGALDDQPWASGKLLQPVMSVSTNGYLTSAQALRIVDAVTKVRAKGFVVHLPTIGLSRHQRGGKDLMKQGPGWRIPMSTVVGPVDYVRRIGGAAIARVLSAGKVAIGATSAELRGARVGDSLWLRDTKSRPRRFEVGAIVPDSAVEWGDLLMSSETAVRLGKMDISRVSIVDIPSPNKVLRALSRRGIAVGRDYRLRTSWDLPNPDGTLGLASVKSMWGEFSFRPTYGAGMMVSSDWLGRNIVWRHRYKDIGLRNNCQRDVIKALDGAFGEIRRRGLAKHIDVADSSRAGGCFVGRYNRLGGSFGAPSRHAWGMAIDLNISTNPQWGVPKMNCDVVRIFRKWGFAWGGNFWPSDGMHFEYVGERRDQLGYPSRYCRNKVPIPTTTLPDFPDLPATTTTTTTTTTTSTSTTTTTTTSTSTTTTTTVPDTTTTTSTSSTTTSTTTTSTTTG